MRQSLPLSVSLSVPQAKTITVEPGLASVFNSEIVSPVFPSSVVHTSGQVVPQKVFVVTRDSFGNKLSVGGMGSSITINFQLKNGDVVIPSDLTDENDGTYSGPMTIKKAGQYVAKATMNGESLESRDLLLEPSVLVAANTLVYAEGNTPKFTAGQNSTVLLQVSPPPLVARPSDESLPSHWQRD